MDSVQVEVREVFAEVTRYPIEILHPQANLEEELGIDSVKLGEVFSVLRERYHLPKDLAMAGKDLATIAGVSKALAEFVGSNGNNGNGRSGSNGSAKAARKPAARHTTEMPLADKSQSEGSLLEQIKAVFAEVTRYPEEILDPQASLEEELGVDSVKLGEVFSVLRERYSLPQDLEIPRENLRSIADISNTLRGYLASAVLPQTVVEPGAARTVEHDSDGAIAPTDALQLLPVADSAEDLTETVRSVFAEVTRYPAEILDPAADLEQDLGIDSVKLGEVFSVLRERYSLPLEMVMPKENLGTIAGITAALHQYLVSKPAGSKAVTSRAIAPLQVVASPPSTEKVEELLVSVFAEVTRYPAEILDPGADLEQDLGIDSVKLGEVFSVLRERFHLPEHLDVPREKLRSIREVGAMLVPYVAAPPVPEQASAAPFSVRDSVSDTATPTHPRSIVDVSTTAEHVDAALYSYEKPTSKPFAGKVLFVSGSGRGLGRDVALYLGELGASVVVNSFHSRTKGEETAKEIRDRGGDAIHVWGSMANPEHVNRVFDDLEAHYGHLDFFVANASNGMLARLEDTTVEHWEKAYRTNVIGLHLSALRAVALMRRRGGGKIITLSSPAAHGYVDYFGCMGTVKAAVESLTRSMAIEYAPYNIQVNCVSPGPVYGELLNKWPDSERLVRQWESNTAYKRLCEARDVSHFIAYLLSEPVKLFTGSVLIMDGGISSQGW
jgi:NAD(P)-dependent dehydrogenase (short-subunit alcohol dehydrogenase family)/acyl carrier protein